MNVDKLIQQFEDAIETREIFWMVGDHNMVKAWEEQCEFIYEKIINYDRQ